jgi:hypothetical protein
MKYIYIDIYIYLFTWKLFYIFKSSFAFCIFFREWYVINEIYRINLTLTFR